MQSNSLLHGRPVAVVAAALALVLASAVAVSAQTARAGSITPHLSLTAARR